MCILTVTTRIVSFDDFAQCTHALTMKFIPHYRCEISLIEQHRGGTCVLVKTRQLHPNACLFSFRSKNSYAIRTCIVHHSILSSLLSFVSPSPRNKVNVRQYKGLIDTQHLCRCSWGCLSGRGDGVL